MSSSFLSLLRLTAYILFTLISMPLQAFFLKFMPEKARLFPHFYHGTCLKIMGIKVKVKGKMSESKPTLFVSNHTSYLDIAVLGSIIPGSFISKAEVGTWPVFGTLSKLQRTVYVDRLRQNVKTHKSAIEQRLQEKDNLILFPEGTSSDGNRVLPFKSALFSVAETKVSGTPVTVQPVSIAYARLDGIPVGFHLRPFYGWYGDMGMGDHIWRMLGLGRLTVELEFHETFDMRQFSSRKAMAEYAQALVAAGVNTSLTGKVHPVSRQAA